MNHAEDLDRALRPQSFKDFIGQNDIKNNLSIYTEAAKLRKERGEHDWVLDHTLFCGPPGLGKTSLSYIIAKEMEAKIECTSGPVIEKPGDLAGILTKLEEGDILFIDEIHRMRTEIEEFLYSAMEDNKIDIVIGNGTSSRTMELTLSPFTLVGATTREDLLTKPLRDRFGINEALELYSLEETKLIAKRSARLLGTDIDEEAQELIGKASRGVPRQINNFIKRLRDVAQVKGSKIINKEIAKIGLKMLRIDEHGLGDKERKILKLIYDSRKGIGLKNIARSLGIGEQAVENVYEPFLLSQGFIKVTANGRVITHKGLSALGIPSQKKIFDL